MGEETIDKDRGLVNDHNWLDDYSIWAKIGRQCSTCQLVTQ